MTDRKRESQFKGNVRVCPDWLAVTAAFDSLPRPLLREDWEGESIDSCWIFRGHKSQTHFLQPSIERVAPRLDWPLIEHRLLREFQSKARMHMDPAQLPTVAPESKLSWLSIMQHYGAPTRLLDFTYSAYVALYFALRNREEQADYAEVWGIDSIALRNRAAETIRDVDREIRKREGKPPKGGRVSLSPENASSSLQRAQDDDEFWDAATRNALHPCGVRREHFNKKGLVAVTLPPIQNSRLSSQQGVFLFNGAEGWTFEESLALMMQGAGEEWYRRFRVPQEALAQIEGQLFQLNIHDLSLFPDTEGLAGFVRQKIRLHW